MRVTADKEGMDTTVSPQIKLIALVGLLGALALAGAMFFFSRSEADVAVEPLPPPAVVKPKPAATTKPKPVVNAKAKPAVKTKTKAALKASKAAASAPKPAVQAKAVVKVAPKRKPRPAVAPNGLPTPVADQLLRHDIVVVALYVDGSVVDELARDEARAGAGDVEAGFAAVDVSKRRAIAPLLKKLDAVAAPAVVVFGRDGKLKARLDGFADRMIVAELAASTRMPTAA
jgi:hypothetical protein